MGPTRFPLPGRDDDHEDEPDELRTWPSAFPIAGPHRDNDGDGVQAELARIAIRSFTRDLLAWLEDRAAQAGSTWSATHFAAGTAVITLELPRVRGLERRVTIRLAVGEHDGLIREPGA
jgi:hypothetical protein